MSKCEKLLEPFRYLAASVDTSQEDMASFVRLKKSEDKLYRVIIDDYDFYVLANPREEVQLGNLAIKNAMRREESVQYLEERMSFRQLMNYSEPKRVIRSLTVHGPPLNIRAVEDGMYYLFNFKSSPSTTGLRHKGFVKFIKPKQRKPLMDLDCLVDCTCPDFRYRWAWVDKQKGASRIGPKSMNQCINRAPHITNPAGMPGLCKHILALRNWIDNSLDIITSDSPDDGSALSRLVSYAQHRHANEPELMALAKARDYKTLLARLNKREGKPGAIDKAAGKHPKAKREEEPEMTEPQQLQQGVTKENACPTCKGTGQKDSKPCFTCHGSGKNPTAKTNPLDFHGIVDLKPEPLPPEIPGEGEEGKTVDSLAKTMIMNLTEAQQTVRGMMEDATTALQQQPGSIAAMGNQPPTTGAEGEVSAESEALNLLRSINAGISELVPAVQALQQTSLAGPEGEEGVEFPEPGSEGGFDADALDTGGEDSFGAFGGPRRGSAGSEFGELGSEGEEAGLGSAEFEFGSAERELGDEEAARGSASREGSASRGFGGSASREGRGSASASRERGRFGKGRRNPTISGKED
jgi:hypothetical protein